MKKWTKNKWVKRIGYFLFLVLIVLSVLELTYRYQWVDYYAAELKGLNPEHDSDKKNLLIFGDSFSADPNGYVASLRDSLDAEFNVVNCAISGTCVRQASYIAANRMRAFPPDRVICQVYPGNDLLEEEFPVNWSELSVLRNMYWVLAKRFRVITYFNHKFSQVSTLANQDFDESVNSKNQNDFDPEKYSQRCKMLIKADPDYLHNTYHVEADAIEPFEKMLEQLEYIKGLCPEGIPFDVLIIPHAAMVTKGYAQNFGQMGLVIPANDQQFETKLKGKFGESHVWDPTEILSSKEASGVPMYYSNDEHLNQEGQAALSHFVYNQVK